MTFTSVPYGTRINKDPFPQTQQSSQYLNEHQIQQNNSILDALLDKMRTKATQHRILVHPMFKDFDRLNSGKPHSS